MSGDLCAEWDEILGKVPSSSSSPSPATRILGLDPGFATLGYAVVALGAAPASDTLVAMGVVRTQKTPTKRGVLATEDNAVRAREIHRALVRLLDDYAIQAVCAESMSFPRSSSVAAKVALCWGTIIAAADARELPLLQATPQRVKKAIGGALTASKEDVERAVTARFRGAPILAAAYPGGMHEHLFDAAAVVLTCSDSEVCRALRRGVAPVVASR